MKILLYAHCSIGGGMQVCDSLIRTLGIFFQHYFIVCASDRVLDSLKDGFNTPSNVKLLRCPKQGNLSRILSINFALDQIVSKNHIDAVFTVFGPSYWRPSVFHLCGFAISHLVFPDSKFLRNEAFCKKIIFRLMKIIKMRSFRRDSDALVTENPEISNRLILQKVCERAYTVYNTFNLVFQKPNLWDNTVVLPAFNGTTLLTISSYYPHKNLEIMVPAARFLKQKYPDFHFRFVLSILREQIQADINGLEEHFIFLGKISITQCPFLYQQAQIMFLPTLLECFSATWAEAMFMQVPILTSDLPFSHGICKDAAMYVDPYSPESIADSIYILATKEGLRNQLIKNGNIVLQHFSDSEHRMQQYLDIIEKNVFHKTHNKP